MTVKKNMQINMDLARIANQRSKELKDTALYGDGVNFMDLDTDFEPLDEDVMKRVKVNPKLKLSGRKINLMKGKIRGDFKKGTRFDLLISMLVASLVFSGPIIKEGIEFVQEKIDGWETLKETHQENKALDEAAQSHLRSNSTKIDYRIQRQFFAEVLEELESSPNIQNPGLLNKYNVFYSMVTDIDRLEWEYKEAIINGNIDESMEILNSIKHLTSETTIYAGEEFYKFIGSSQYPQYLNAIVEDGTIYYRYEDVEQEDVYYNDVINRDGVVYVLESSKVEVIKGY